MDPYSEDQDFFREAKRKVPNILLWNNRNWETPALIDTHLNVQKKACVWKNSSFLPSETIFPEASQINLTEFKAMLSPSQLEDKPIAFSAATYVIVSQMTKKHIKIP